MGAADYWSRWTSLPAVAAGRTHSVSAADVTLPGPRLDRALRLIAETVHGATLFEALGMDAP